MNTRCYACNGPTDHTEHCFDEFCENHRGKRTSSVHYNFQTPRYSATAGISGGHSWAFYAQQMPFPKDRAHVHSVGNVSLFAQATDLEFEPGMSVTTWGRKFSGLMHLADFLAHVDPAFSDTSCEPWWSFLVNEIDHAKFALECPMAPYSWEEVEAELAKDEPWFCFDSIMSTRLQKMDVLLLCDSSQSFADWADSRILNDQFMECLSYDTQPFMFVPPFTCLNIHEGIFEFMPSINQQGFKLGELSASRDRLIKRMQSPSQLVSAVPAKKAPEPQYRMMLGDEILQPGDEVKYGGQQWRKTVAIGSRVDEATRKARRPLVNEKPSYGEDIRPFLPERKLVMFVPSPERCPKCGSIDSQHYEYCPDYISGTPPVDARTTAVEKLEGVCACEFPRIYTNATVCGICYRPFRDSGTPSAVKRDEPAMEGYFRFHINGKEGLSPKCDNPECPCQRGPSNAACLVNEIPLPPQLICKKCGYTTVHLDSEGLCVERCAPF